MDYENYIVIYTFMDSRHIYIVEEEGLRAMNISWFEGLVKRGYKGLSIVILRALTPNRQIVISLCRFVYNWGYAGYQGLVIMKDNLVNHHRAGEVKEIPNTPIDKQTISSGYKGLKVWQYMLDMKV